MQIRTRLFDNVMTLKTFLSTITSIMPFNIMQKFCKHHFLLSWILQTAKMRQLAIQKLFYYWFTLARGKYFIKLCKSSSLKLGFHHCLTWENVRLFLRDILLTWVNQMETCYFAKFISWDNIILNSKCFDSNIMR